MALGLAAQLGVPIADVHVIWPNGPGSYGRNDADDCAADAAVLAKATGRPVRLQYTRDQGTGWDPKGPASVHRARAAIDSQGNVIAYEFVSKGFSRIDVGTNGSKLPDTLAGHALGVRLASGDGFGVPAESYEFTNKKMSWETIAPLLERGEEIRLGQPALAAQGSDRRQGFGPRHCLCAAQRHQGRGDCGGRDRSLDRENLGEEVHRRP